METLKKLKLKKRPGQKTEKNKERLLSPKHYKEKLKIEHGTR